MSAGYTLVSTDIQTQAEKMGNLWKGLLWITDGYLQRLTDIGNTAIYLAYQNGGSVTYIQDLINLSLANTAMQNIINYASHVGTVSITNNTGGAGISSPPAPSVVPQGTPGSTTWYYQVIAHTLNGTTIGATGTTGSGVGSTTTGATTLTSTNFNALYGYGVAGAVSYDILRWNGSAWRTLGNTTATAFYDTGIVDSSYAVPTTNTTAGSAQTVSVPNGSFCVVTADPTLIAALGPIGTDQTPLIRELSDLTAGASLTAT